MAKQIQILVADADISVREVIRLAATEQGWVCHTAGDGIVALKLIRRNIYHLAVLDMELPEIEGKVVCHHLRKAPGTPVIMMSKDGKEANRLAGFAAGGNDFVVKPFYPRELVARIKNLIELCGTATQSCEVVEIGKITIEVASRAAYVGGSRLTLAPKQYDLLLFFCKNPNQAFSRSRLLDMVWGMDFEGADRTVDSNIKGLRSKLKPYQGYIETVWGYGYKFSVDGR